MHKPWPLLLVVLLLTSWPNPVWTARIATTLDGLAVLLRDNRTWESLEPPRGAPSPWPNPLRPARIATTQDGLVVLLKDNGTWEFPEPPPSPDFRQAAWGMSKAQVKKLEKAKLAQERENNLLYQGKLATFNVSIWYIFVSNMCARGIYVIEESHANKVAHIADYSILKQMLEKKYGRPQRDEVYWINHHYLDDPQQWGIALSLGHVGYYTTWEAERTKITMSLTGENFRISHTIHYQSKALQDLEEKKAIGDL